MADQLTKEDHRRLESTIARGIVRGMLYWTLLTASMAFAGRLFLLPATG